MGTPIDLIVGLGNPGAEYAATRHNAGFWFVDLLAREHGGAFSRERKLHGEAAEIAIGGRRIRLLKPTTYMNLSGQSVGAAVNYYKIPTENALVAYDELDLPPGRMQLKFDGSSAGHKGINSIIEHVGPKFWRLRFGVGHPGNKDEVMDYVLRRAPREEEDQIIRCVGEAVEIFPKLLQDGPEKAMNALHRKKDENGHESTRIDTNKDKGTN